MEFNTTELIRWRPIASLSVHSLRNGELCLLQSFDLLKSLMRLLLGDVRLFVLPGDARMNSAFVSYSAEMHISPASYEGIQLWEMVIGLFQYWGLGPNR